MGQGVGVDPFKQAAVPALVDLGYTPSQASRHLNLPRITVYDILAKTEGGAYKNKPVLDALREGIKTRLQARSMDLADRALDQVEAGLQETDAYRSTLIYGILRDKERLDADEPTQITASFNAVVVKDLDQLCSALSESLLKK